MSEKGERIIRAGDMERRSETFSHPLNPDSQVSFTQLAPLAGLKRLAVSLSRVPPGKESFIYHRHAVEEEWVYILRGEAESDIDGRVERAEPGDFIGYPPGTAHTLRNVGEEDLVYLMGGEQLTQEVAEFPRHAKRLLLNGDRAEMVDEDAIKPFGAD